MWGETETDTLQTKAARNFNPLSPCGERLCERFPWRFRKIISIHSPHVGRDVDNGRFDYIIFDISIHSPHVGRDAYNHSL